MSLPLPDNTTNPTNPIQAANGKSWPWYVGLVRGVILAAAALALAWGMGYVLTDTGELELLRVGLATLAVRVLEGVYDQAKT